MFGGYWNYHKHKMHEHKPPAGANYNILTHVHFLHNCPETVPKSKLRAIGHSCCSRRYWLKDPMQH